MGSEINGLSFPSSQAPVPIDMQRRIPFPFPRGRKALSERVKACWAGSIGSRKTVTQHFLCFHAIPLGTAMMLIILNLQTRFYGFDGRWISALQFVAKVHELLMQLSIGVIAVAYLQHLLSHKKAVPFGVIFSAYNITQMSYLWSREFWGAVTAPDFRGSRRIAFVLFVSFTILLTAGVGPSSAIAMQPRFANFTISDYPISLNITVPLMYPDTFMQPGLPLVDPESPYYSGLSQATGWEYLQNLPTLSSRMGPEYHADYGLVGGQSPGSNDDFFTEYMMPPLYNIQIRSRNPTWTDIGQSSTESTRTLYVQYAPNSTFTTISHVPVALALDLANVMSIDQLNSYPGVAVLSSTSMPQAFTSVLCQLNTIMSENDTRPIQFPSTYIAGCTDECGCTQAALNGFRVTNYTTTTRKQIWEQSMKRPEGQIVWLDNIESTGPVPGRYLGAIVIQPEPCGVINSFLTTSACMIGAQWANATLYQQIQSEGYYDIPSAAQNIFTRDSPSALPDWSIPSLNLSAAWARSLTPLTTTQNRTVADNLLRALPSTDIICPENGSYPGDIDHHDGACRSENLRPFMHEALLAGLVANGLAQAAGATQRWTRQTAGSRLWAYTNWHGEMQSSADAPGVVLVSHGQLPGYAWNREGVPILLACAILILYSLFVAAYVGYTFWTGRSSLAWSAISDLVVLALVSGPLDEEVLEVEGERHKKIGLFQKKVTLRDSDGNARSRLVFPSDEEPKEE